ncbi:glycosyltransferase family 4 protein [Serratia proteamaculans]|uniref:glycosyltransferase family 4 protein n=1 Tax=Serratia proteamaculans TaxID=28151 RepID=UPI001C5702EC|nr:glycosyltransferase family 4 protein [Serratia proteamaculans]WEO91259.1 glycosyltransferase family 4 protein [Serratia proteamaculans]
MNNNVTIPMVGLTNHGGVRVLVQLANFLDENGFNVEIMCPSGCNNTKYKINSGVRVTEFGPKIKSKYLRWLFFTLASPLKIKSNYIICNFFLTFYIGFLRKKINKETKISYLIQDIEYEFVSGYFKFFAKYMCEFTYKYNNAEIVAANVYLYEKLIVSNENIKRINIWIDERFKTRNRMNSERTFDVIYFLRDDPRKRLDRFDSILLKLKSIGASIACITQSTELKNKYLNRVDHIYMPNNDDELIDIIDLSKTLLLTSSQEGFSLPPLECMARGVIPVIYKCGGPEIYLKDGVNGFVVNSESEAMDKLTFLLKDEESYLKFQSECIITSREFSMDKEFEFFKGLIS